MRQIEERETDRRKREKRRERDREYLENERVRGTWVTNFLFGLQEKRIFHKVLNIMNT